MEPEAKDLLVKAREALQCSYAPYSNFRVGAAVLASDGRIFQGANIENASYGLTICAERAAIFNARMHGAGRMVQIAVTTAVMPTMPEEGMPCGPCRQVMAEFMDMDAPVILDNIGTFSLYELLPHPFKLRLSS